MRFKEFLTEQEDDQEVVVRASDAQTAALAIRKAKQNPQMAARKELTRAQGERAVAATSEDADEKLLARLEQQIAQVRLRMQRKSG